MNKCKDFAKNYFSDYVELNLSEPMQKKVDSHIQNCRACRIISNDVMKIIRSMKNSVESMKVSEEFDQKLRQKIFNQGKKQFNYSNLHTGFNIAASFLFVISLGFLFWNSTQPASDEYLVQNKVSIVPKEQSIQVTESNSQTSNNLTPVGWVGIQATTNTDNQVVLTEVVKGHPADKAGLKANDVILEINKTPISHIDQLNQLITQSNNHSKEIVFKIERDQKIQTFIVQKEQKFIKN